MPDPVRSNLLPHTAEVVAAYLSYNQLGVEALPQLIKSVHQALSGAGARIDASITRPEPAVPVRKSVFPDYLVCLGDGAKMKMLKRYIWNRYGLTPAAYRERWGLPRDYPMVAPSYTERRSTLARQFGLGRKAIAEQPSEPAPKDAEKSRTVRKGRTPTGRKAVAAEGTATPDASAETI